MSGWRTCVCWALAGLAGMAIGACGSQTQAASEPKGKFTVAPSASFPTSQRLSGHAQMVVKVTNNGSKTIPNVAVTITDGTPSHPDMGTQLQAFSYCAGSVSGRHAVCTTPADYASSSRPVWIVDQAPGRCGYSCKTGGPGAAVTAYSNTWALGALKPGRTATFVWHLTAVQPGAWVVNWRVDAGLFGNAKAVLQGGGIPRGSFTVHITQKPPQAYVNNSGQIVTTP